MPTSNFLRNASDLLSVVPRRSDKLRAAVVYGGLWVKKRLGRRGGRLVGLTVGGPNGRTHRFAVGEYSDLLAITDVFAARTYADTSRGQRVETVLDLGSNIGASAVWFKMQWPDAVVHAVEPDPESFRKLQRNTEGLPGVSLHPLAVGGTDGTVRFHQSLLGLGSSVGGDHMGLGGRWIDVTMVSLGALLTSIGVDQVDVLKMDIEGAEWDIFSAVRLGTVAGVVAGEIHGDLEENRAGFDHGLEGFDVAFHDDPADHFVAHLAA